MSFYTGAIYKVASACPALLTSPDPIESLHTSGVALVKDHWYYPERIGLGLVNKTINTRVYPTMASPTVIYTVSIGGTNPNITSLCSDGTMLVWVEFDAAIQSQVYELRGMLVDDPSSTFAFASPNRWSAVGLTYHPTTGLFYWIQRVDHGSGNYQDTLYSFTPQTAAVTTFTTLWQSSIGVIGDGTHIDVSQINTMAITPSSIFGMTEPYTGFGEWGAWRFDVNTATMYFDGVHQDPIQPGGLIGTPADTLVFNSSVIDHNTKVQEFNTGLSTTTWGYREWPCSPVVGDFIGPGWQSIEGNFERYTMSNGSDVYEWPGGSSPAAPANSLFAGAVDLGTATSGTTALVYNKLATAEPSSPVPVNGPGTGPWLPLWWKWTCPGGFVGSISFDTFASDALHHYGGNMDTVLAIYTGASLAGLTEVVSNDDAAGGSSPWQSKVTFTPTPGTVYWIQASAYPSSVGGVQVSWA